MTTDYNVVLTRNKKLEHQKRRRSMLKDFKMRSETLEFKRKYIEMLPAEDPEMFDYKLKTYEVFNVVKRTIEMLSAKPFQSAATIETDNEFLKTLKKDFDGYGNSMTRFLMRIFTEGLWDTQAHILIDNQEDSTINSRPTCELLNNDNILQADIGKGGKLVRFRFREKYDIYNEKTFDTDYRWRVKYLEQKNEKTVIFKIFEEDEKGQMNLVKSGIYGNDHIPVVSFNPMDYANPFLPDDLIFNPMALINKQLLQKDCDLNNIVSIICFPLLIGTGFDSSDDNVKKNMKIGPNNMVLIDDEKANLKFVEHTGAAVNTGFKYISELVMRMNSLGFEMFSQRTGAAVATATENKLSASGNNSLIASFALNLNDTANKIVDEIMHWKEMDLKADENYYSIDIKTDYSISISAEEMNGLVNSHQTGAITNKQYVFELKRRGILDENFIYDENNDNNIENIVYE